MKNAETSEVIQKLNIDFETDLRAHLPMKTGPVISLL